MNQETSQGESTKTTPSVQDDETTEPNERIPSEDGSHRQGGTGLREDHEPAPPGHDLVSPEAGAGGERRKKRPDGG